MRKNIKLLGAVAVAGLVATSGSAFTAGNTVADSDAGSGVKAISPFTTSDIQYDADDTTPTDLAGVTFTLNKAARYVAIQTKASGAWYQSDDDRFGDSTATPATVVHSCTTGDQITWTCDVTGTGETVAAADNLTVVATS